MSLTRVSYIEDTGSGCCGVLVCKTRADYAEEEETYLHIILWLGVSGPFPASPSNNNSREVRSEIGRGQVLNLQNVVFGM